MEELLKELNLTEAELPREAGVYSLPDTIEYHGIPFRVKLAFAQDYFFGFSYEAELTGSNEEIAQKCLTVAQAFTDALGKPILRSQVGTENAFTDLTQEQMTNKLAVGGYSEEDGWVLGQVEIHKYMSKYFARNEEMKQTLKEQGKRYTNYDYSVPPLECLILKLDRSEQGTYILRIEYELSVHCPDFSNDLHIMLGLVEDPTE